MSADEDEAPLGVLLIVDCLYLPTTLSLANITSVFTIQALFTRPFVLAACFVSLRYNAIQSN